MDHLLDLDEEFDLPDSAATALQIIARTDVCALCEMVTNARRDLLHLVDDAEIERAPPDERFDRGKEALAELDVSGAGAGANECRSLPRQGT